jgi:hypothetical protein
MGNDEIQCCKSFVDERIREKRATCESMSERFEQNQRVEEIKIRKRVSGKRMVFASRSRDDIEHKAAI